MGKKKRIVIRPSLSRALIVHPDPPAVRSFYVKAYEEQLRLLGKATEKLRHYFDVDQPAFTLWWQQHFSEELTLQMQLHEERERLLVLIYERLKQKQIDEEKKSEPRKKQKPPPTEKQDQEQQPHIARDAPKPQGEAEDKTESYARKMYHELVRLLHPDAQGQSELSEEQKRQWAALQNAYQWRDLDGMERIYAAVKGQAAHAANFGKLPISDIIAMKDKLSEKLGSLKEELHELKKEANWNFEKRRTEHGFLRQIARAIEFELREESSTLREEIHRLKAQIKAWAQAAKKKKPAAAKP